MALGSPILEGMRNFLNSSLKQRVTSKGAVISLDESAVNEVARMFHLAVENTTYEILRNIHSSLPKEDRRQSLDDPP